MSAPLPEALRARFQKYIEEGLSGRAAALRLRLSAATGARWANAIRRTGQARAAPQGRPKGGGKLDPHRAFFTEVIGQDADITTSELATALRTLSPHYLNIKQYFVPGESEQRQVFFRMLWNRHILLKDSSLDI